MRISKLFYLALLCVILGWSACEDDDDVPVSCNFDIPTVRPSNSCEPALVTFGKLDAPVNSSGPALPADCGVDNGLTRTAQLSKGPNDNTLQLQVYNGTRGILYLQVFGTFACDENYQTILPCTPITAAAELIPLNNLAQYSEVFVRLDFTDESGNPMRAEAADFVSLATSPQITTGRTIKYGGTNGDFPGQRITASCNGRSFQRLILFTCDPSADLAAWVNETGLNASESYQGRGGQATAVDVPPGLDPNTVGPAVSQKRLDRNEDDFIVEEDFIITVPGPSSGGLIDFGQFEGREPNEVYDCLLYEPGNPSTQDRGKQMIVTMIDSGVELGGNWDREWERHVNQSTQDQFLGLNRLGYDFFYGDPEPEDNIGHGTNTTGALIGNYSGDLPLTVVNYKVFGAEGLSTYYGALVALFSAVDIGSNVINCSWGYVDNVTPRAMECAIRYAGDNKVVVVTSAGNDANDISLSSAPQWPASFGERYQHVISVASYQFEAPEITDAPYVSAFSNFGDPAVRVAAYLTAKTPGYGLTDFNFKAGTSISAPVVASEIANSLANTGALNDYQNLLRNSTNFFQPIFRRQYLPICLRTEPN
ncbi:S8 family serine peptidase [Neolewinella lacunae]|uniref:S8 family serine peptidase n=1 Tax=Neolewinella lacunae TaxID=1517758 RepID=A0A923PNB7_9BACT|nr:S8 family serine peptidase [Neolewinella lacunae]MBC6994831.1 S8 family serine peptidase [Neolewinella lacunae]MDN3634452.1 S8 family serine peptidase [Neolewinella lacunae]